MFDGMTREEYRAMMSRHRFINGPTFKRAVAAANRRADELERLRRGSSAFRKAIKMLIEGTPAQQKQRRELEKLRNKARIRLEPILKRLVQGARR